MTETTASQATQLSRVLELGLLSASLLHELRQPLFALQAHTQLALVDGQMTAERLLELAQQVGHLQELVDAYSGVGGAAGATLFDLNDAVRAALRTLQPRCSQVGVRVAATLAGELLPVHGRVVAIRQVSINLVTNALEAVGSRAGHVWVETRRDGDMVELIVRDDGPGMPAEVRGHVFEPFVSDKASDNSGLGLYVTRRLVLEAGGTVGVHGAPGEGATVVVRLPRSG